MKKVLTDVASKEEITMMDEAEKYLQEKLIGEETLLIDLMFKKMKEISKDNTFGIWKWNDFGEIETEEDIIKQKEISISSDEIEYADYIVKFEIIDEYELSLRIRIKVTEVEKYDLI